VNALMQERQRPAYLTELRDWLNRDGETLQ
jgi:hypothetical protein